MKTKLLNFTLGIQKILMFVLLLFALGSIGCFIVSKFITDVNLCNALMYFIFGEVLFPVRAIVIMISGLFTDINAMMIMGVVVGSIFLVFTIICILFLSKKKSNKKSKLVGRLITSFILMAFFSFVLITFVLDYNNLNIMVNALGSLSEPTKIFLNSIGSSVVVIKYFVISSLVAFWSLITFIVSIVCRDKIKEQKVVESVVFYSQSYLAQDSKNKEKVNEQIIEEKSPMVKAKQKKQAQELISRIMHLNQLKESGQISDVEYTKLRQRVIKRYKG